MSNPDLTIFVPTRNRRGNVLALHDACERTCTAKTQVVYVLDADDHSCDDIDVIKVKALTDRRGMTQALNLAFESYLRTDNLGFAVGFMGDDHRPRTRGWDERYLYELNWLQTGMVYGDDLFQHERIPTQIAMTTDIPSTLGHMVPDNLHHLYVDDYWKALGTGIGRIKYLPDVIVEHLHYLNGKAEVDEGYELVNSHSMASHDAREWRKMQRNGQLKADIVKLQGILK